MCGELFLPKGFQPVSYENPELWTLTRDRLREVFEALPDLTGYVLYLTEEKGPEVEFLPGSETSKTRRARKLIETILGFCHPHAAKEPQASGFPAEPGAIEGCDCEKAGQTRSSRVSFVQVFDGFLLGPAEIDFYPSSRCPSCTAEQATPGEAT